jgi:hypothetical protein
VDFAAVNGGLKMKKSISAILSVLLVLALALTLFSCGKTGDTDETTGDGDMQTTEEVMTEYDVTKDAFELSLYTDSSSASYRALGDPVQIFKTGSAIYPNDRIRFVSNVDGVIVTLVKLKYNEADNEMESDGILFSVKVKKGEVYEFDGSLAETVPTAAIEAEKGGMAARKVLTYDGRDGKTDYVLKSEPLLFDEAVG